MKRFGFFQRPDREQARAELSRLRSQCPQPNEDLVVAYLNGGTPITLIPGINTDLLADERRVIVPPNAITDGEWIWSQDVVFYIKEYHIEVPEEFKLRMERHAWICPPVIETQRLLEELALFKLGVC